MRIRLIAPLAVVLTVSANAQIADADIETAIKAGLEKKSLSVTVDAFDFTVVVEGPMARVASAAKAAAAQYKPFMRTDVSTAMLEPTVTIEAWPDPPTVAPYRGLSSTYPATHLVVMPKGAKSAAAAIQPTTKEPIHQSWSNAVGAKVEGTGIRATFPMSALPAGEFDVMVVCEGCPTDRKGQIKKRDRERIR